LPVFGRRWGNPDSRLLRLAEVGRSFVRDGSRRICSQVGSLLAEPSLPLKNPTAVLIGLMLSATDLSDIFYAAWALIFG